MPCVPKTCERCSNRAEAKRMCGAERGMCGNPSKQRLTIIVGCFRQCFLVAVLMVLVVV